MAKTIVRETIIILLLCLAIILVLGVVLYNYVPTNKVVPTEVSYVQTEEVNKAIKESVSADNTQVILTYEIDEADLRNYKKSGDLNPGKTNPFSPIKVEEDENTEEDTTTENKVTSSNTKKNNTSKVDNEENDTTSENGTLFPDKGTK